MTEIQNTDRRPHHRLTAGDTPVHGLPIEQGTGGRRHRAAALLGVDPIPTDAIGVGDPVLWHARVATVAEVYPPREAWTPAMCRITFEDGGRDVHVGRDELELIEQDGARYFEVRPSVLEETAPLPSPVPREVDGTPTEQLVAVDDLADDEVDATLSEANQRLSRALDRTVDVEAGLRAVVVARRRGADTVADESVSGTLPGVATVPASRSARFWRAVLAALLDVLRHAWLIVGWPVRRLTASWVGDVVFWLVEEIAEGVEAAAKWEYWHSRLVAKLLLALLSAAVFGGVGVLWVLR